MPVETSDPKINGVDPDARLGPLGFMGIGERDPTIRINDDLHRSASWFDFDTYYETNGYTGRVIIDELPSCGTLMVVEGQVVDGQDLSGVSMQPANANEEYDMGVETFFFDSDGCAE